MTQKSTARRFGLRPLYGEAGGSFGSWALHRTAWGRDDASAQDVINRKAGGQRVGAHQAEALSDGGTFCHFEGVMTTKTTWSASARNRSMAAKVTKVKPTKVTLSSRRGSRWGLPSSQLLLAASDLFRFLWKPESKRVECADKMRKHRALEQTGTERLGLDQELLIAPWTHLQRIWSLIHTLCRFLAKAFRILALFPLAMKLTRIFLIFIHF